MGGRGSSSTSNSNSSYQVLGANVAPTAQAAATANGAAFPATDTRGFHDLYNGRQYFLNQNLTIDQQLATINYLSDTTESGSLYSMSQNLNHALATGKKLTANQQFVYNNLMGAMHNLGQNLNLTRYDHDSMINTLLNAAGMNRGYQNYTQNQLKQALVGAKFGENKFLSTSYNDFKNAPSRSKSVFDSRAVKITYKAKASTQAMMPGNGPGGALGEIILAPSGGKQNMTVKDVRFTGRMARAKGTQSYTLPEVELIIEVD